MVEEKTEQKTDEQKTDVQTEVKTEQKTDGVKEKDIARIVCKQFEPEKMLKYVQCEGKLKGNTSESLMKDALITCEKNEMNVYGADGSSIVFVRVKVKDVEVQKEGAIPVLDIATAISQLKRYNANDELEITIENGKFMTKRESPKKIATSPTTLSSRIESVTGMAESIDKSWSYKEGEGYVSAKGFKCNVILKTSASYLNELVDDENFVEQLRFPLVVKDNKFVVSIGSDESSRIETEIPCTEISGNSKTTLAFGICAVLKTVDNDVTIFMPEKTDGPVWIRQETDKFLVEYFISPIVEEK